MEGPKSMETTFSAVASVPSDEDLLIRLGDVTTLTRGDDDKVSESNRRAYR